MHYILLQMFNSSIYLRNKHHLLQLIDGGGSGGSVRCINGELQYVVVVVVVIADLALVDFVVSMVVAVVVYSMCCVYSGNKVFLTIDVTGDEIPFPDLNLSLWLCAGVLEWRSHLACCGGKGDLDLPAQLPRSARFLGRHLRLQHLQKRRAQCR
jgi:hypothetical protein